MDVHLLLSAHSESSNRKLRRTECRDIVKLGFVSKILSVAYTLFCPVIPRIFKTCLLVRFPKSAIPNRSHTRNDPSRLDVKTEIHHNFEHSEIHSLEYINVFRYSTPTYMRNHSIHGKGMLSCNQDQEGHYPYSSLSDARMLPSPP